MRAARADRWAVSALVCALMCALLPLDAASAESRPAAESHDEGASDGPTLPLTRELPGQTPLSTTTGAAPQVIPASRYGPQPVFRLPFAPGKRWGASGSHADSDGIHRGAIDFAPLSSADKKVRAVAAGVVYRVRCSGGWFLGIDHGGGWMSEYYHLTGARSSLIGTWVEAGTHLGNAGQTLPCGGTPGNSPHVHLSILNEATDVPSGKRHYVAVSGIQFDQYALRDSSGAYNGVWRDLAGAKVLTSRGVTCCLRASSRVGPASPAASLPDTDGNGIDDYADATEWSTDLNADGRPDLVGFGKNSVFTARNSGTTFTSYASSVTGFGSGKGWSRAAHPRMVIDITGDGRADIVGFADDGVYVSIGTGSGFGAPQRWATAFSTSRGWKVGLHQRVIADVTGDDLPDVVGFGGAGVYVARNTGSSFAAPRLWAAAMQTSRASGGWIASRHPRMVADVTGDGLADLVGFGNRGVYVARNTGNGFGAATLEVRSFGADQGWKVAQHPRYVADVNGDGLADIVGFGTRGVTVAVNTGASFAAPTRWSASFGTASGAWRGDRNGRTLADVNGDGRLDVVGFRAAGTYIALNRGSSFGGATRWTAGFGATEWTQGWMPRSLVDVNGDDRADIVGFARDGVHVALSSGSRFGAAAHWSQSFGYGSFAGTWRVATHPRAIAG